MRTKRSLFHQNGSEKDEYKTFKLTSSVLDPQREKIFTNEPKKVRPSSKTQIDDWGPMFGGKKISYSKAIERVANELNEKNKLHQNNKLHQKEKRSVKFPSQHHIVKLSENSFKQVRNHFPENNFEQVRNHIRNHFPENNFEQVRNNFRNHFPENNFEHVRSHFGNPFLEVRNRYPELNHLPDSFVMLKAFIDEQEALRKKGSGASPSGVNEVRNSGVNQTGGGTNTGSRNEGNDNRGSGVGLEGDRTGESMKGTTNVINSGGRRRGINSGGSVGGSTSGGSGGRSNIGGSGGRSNSGSSGGRSNSGNSDGGSNSLWSQFSSAYQSLLNFLSFNM